MQRYFLDQESHAFIPSSRAIIPGLKRLIECFLSNDQPVVLTRHLNNSDNAGMLEIWWADVIEEGNRLSEIIPELQTGKTKVLEKSQYDAFHKTELDGILKKQNIEQVVISGVMTHLCCETTARSAFVNGYHVIFPVDGSATYDINFHRATLQNLSHGFAMMTSVADLCRMFD